MKSMKAVVTVLSMIIVLAVAMAPAISAQEAAVVQMYRSDGSILSGDLLSEKSIPVNTVNDGVTLSYILNEGAEIPLNADYMIVVSDHDFVISVSANGLTGWIADAGIDVLLFNDKERTQMVACSELNKGDGYQSILSSELVSGKKYYLNMNVASEIKSNSPFEDIIGVSFSFFEATDYSTVTFDPNGGTVKETKRALINGQPIGDLPIPTRASYSFDGWFTEKTGGQVVSTSMIITKDETFYAHWTEKKPEPGGGGHDKPDVPVDMNADATESITVSENDKTINPDGSVTTHTTSTNVYINGRTTITDTTSTATKKEGTTHTNTLSTTTSSDEYSSTTRSESTTKNVDGKSVTETRSVTESSDGSTIRTESTTTTSNNGTSTVESISTITSPDGSVIVSESRTETKNNKDGSVITDEQTKETASDGSVTISTKQTTHSSNRDGSTTVREKAYIVNPDSSEETSDIKADTRTLKNGTISKTITTERETRDYTEESKTDISKKNDGSMSSTKKTDIVYKDGSETHISTHVDMDKNRNTVKKMSSQETSSSGVITSTESSEKADPSGKIVTIYRTITINDKSGVTQLEITGSYDRIEAFVPSTDLEDVDFIKQSVSDIRYETMVICTDTAPGETVVPEESLRLMAENGYLLSVSDGKESVVFDNRTLSNLSLSNGDVTIIIERATEDNMTSKQIPVVGNNYGISVKLIQKGEEISQLEGTAVISVKPGYAASFTYYVDKNGGTEGIESSFDRTTGEVTFEIEHLSIYMVTISEVDPISEMEAWTVYAIIIIVASLIIALSAYGLLRRHNRG